MKRSYFIKKNKIIFFILKIYRFDDEQFCFTRNYNVITIIQLYVFFL